MKAHNTVALIHTQFGPYHFARARALMQIYPESVRLIQLASHEVQRQWIVDADTPDVTTVAEGTLETLVPKMIATKLVECLTEIAPSVIVIAGYSHPAMRAATGWVRRQGVATVLLSDSQHLDRLRNPIKEGLKGFWIRRNFDAAFVAGASASFYLSNLGFPYNRIWRGYDVVNNTYFAQAAEAASNLGEEIRKKLGLPEHYFLYVGRFSSEKNLLRLLEAYQVYLQHTEQEVWSLVLVGSGPQEAKLKAKANQLGLKDIFWIEFKQLDELPVYYSLATALILPSVSEPWGLVVNEAMACGLPVLISDRCGCVPDLVFPGINGYIFNSLSVEGIAAAMLSMNSKSDQQCEKMRQASKRIIANYTPEIWAQALVDCIQFILNDFRGKDLVRESK